MRTDEITNGQRIEHDGYNSHESNGHLNLSDRLNVANADRILLKVRNLDQGKHRTPFSRGQLPRQAAYRLKIASMRRVFCTFPAGQRHSLKEWQETTVRRRLTKLCSRRAWRCA